MDGLGASVARLEDPPLLRGLGRFAADINLPGQLHMRVVRAGMAHARVGTIHTAEALALPGVVAIWTGADVADIPPIGFRQMGLTELEPYRQPILAQGVVRYVGEPVAVIFAEDPYVAEDAEELVFAELDALPVTMTATGAIGAFDAAHGSEPTIIRKAYGDLDAAFAAAAVTVELELTVGRHTGVPIETRGALAICDAAGAIAMYGASKVPHANRIAICRMLDLPLERLHLHEGHVGGGFGIRGELYLEDVLVCLAAQRLRRPVKWIEDRREHLLAANHSRDQVHHIRAAVDANGFVLGVADEFYVDQGAYVRTHASTVPDLAAGMLPGPYIFPAYTAAAHMRLTNKTPSGTYRAPGRYEGSFVRERLMDAIAARLGLDPVAVRRVNLIPPSAMPFDRGIGALGTPLIYDSGDYALLLDKFLRYLDYDAVQDRLAARRVAGECVGAGLAFFVEKSGLGPFDDVRLELRPNGRAELITGAASVGQGVETSLAQITAACLGVAHTDVTVIHGQTDRIARGMGAFATRVTVMTGSAIALAAAPIRDRLLAKAAELMQQRASDLSLRDGQVIGPGPSMTIASVVQACLAEDGSDCLEQQATFESGHMTYPYGIHLAIAKVDPETGHVRLERFSVAYDIGRAVNPMLVEGQIQGGAAQGIGGALLEEFVYTEDGQPLCTSLAEYLMPTAAEMPQVDVLLTEDAPSRIGSLGVKGAGEGGTTAAGAAIAAAVDAALGGRVAITRLPLTPARLHAAMAR